MLAKVVLFEKRALKAIIIKWAPGHLAQDLYKYSYNSNSRKYFLPFFIRAKKKLNLNLPLTSRSQMTCLNLAHHASENEKFLALNTESRTDLNQLRYLASQNQKLLKKLLTTVSPPSSLDPLNLWILP